MKKVKSKKIAVVHQDCVACGNCAKYCPRRAITIDRGICAVVDESLCVGCGKCEQACPAGTIEIVAREVVYG
ncbi:ferredoxin [Lachnospiraceae bacterium PM6-15]|uniref:ATP-binding protein n=1 Tax=Ohessyouella blattaphilus TaxID=2949333 RepID=UPI003E265899